MTLTQQEIELFYRLWYALIWGVNEKHCIVDKFEKPTYEEPENEEAITAVREKLWENPEWIDEFICDNEYCELTDIERGILADWRRKHIKDRFIVLKHLKKHSVFLSFSKPAKLYGVCGISKPISDVSPLNAPYMADFVLLPFNEKIIYDGFIITLNVRFGKGARDNFFESYNEIKKTAGIIENMSLPPTLSVDMEMKPKAPKKAPPVVDTKDANVPKAMSARYMEIAEIIEDFCDENLDDEYKDICLRALAKLCRKRPSPLISGRANTWACGIVYAIGSKNFIFDKSQPINMTATDIAKWFGLAKSTAGSKANQINSLLNLSYFNTEFALSSVIANNPMIWYVSINGYTVDIRTMPRHIQEEAYHKGLIPYIPMDN